MDTSAFRMTRVKAKSVSLIEEQSSFPRFKDVYSQPDSNSNNKMNFGGKILGNVAIQLGPAGRGSII